VLAVALEIIGNGVNQSSPTIKAVTSAVNWVYFTGFLAMSFIIRRWAWPGKLVCPLLTAIVFYYFAFVDFQNSAAVLYFTLIISITTAFFFVVVFGEHWITTTATFMVCIIVLMKRIGIDLLGEAPYELAIKAIYTTFIYAVIAYLSEQRSKQAFTGAESSDKAFYKWLRIFETFPEGIALVRNNYILYANKALKGILEVHLDQYLEGNKTLNKNDLLKRQLMETRVTPYDKRGDPSAATNVWQFLAKNERGATFELPMADEEKPKKYVTLNQVNVNVAGSKDKLLLVRDVTHIIYLEQIMETKHQMSIFTDSLMKQI
jgi:hypothetical protein